MCMNMKRKLTVPQSILAQAPPAGARYRKDVRIGDRTYHYEYTRVQQGSRVVCMRRFVGVTEEGIPDFLANFLNTKKPFLDTAQMNISKEEVLNAKSYV